MVKRYDLNCVHCKLISCWCMGIAEIENGPYVLHSDYAALQGAHEEEMREKDNQRRAAEEELLLVISQKEQTEAELARLKAEQSRDAIDGQATMEEAYNRIKELEADNSRLKEQIRCALLKKAEKLSDEKLEKLFKRVEVEERHYPTRQTSDVCNSIKNIFRAPEKKEGGE